MADCLVPYNMQVFNPMCSRPRHWPTYQIMLLGNRACPKLPARLLENLPHGSYEFISFVSMLDISRWLAAWLQASDARLDACYNRSSKRLGKERDEKIQDEVLADARPPHHSK
ncbi:hypothetical protein PZA11_007146 [Diplocarpon coronariae]